MNDSEKRRQMLLKETRRLYSNNYTPAVHPRYSAVYHSLNDTYEASENSDHTLGVRILISLIIFAFFAAAEYHDEKLWKFTPDQIISEIQNQPDLPSGVYP